MFVVKIAGAAMLLIAGLALTAVMAIAGGLACLALAPCMYRVTQGGRPS